LFINIFSKQIRFARAFLFLDNTTITAHSFTDKSFNHNEKISIP